MVIGFLAFAVASAGAGTYDEWCRRHFEEGEIGAGLASPVRDADCDGSSNLLEYLCGTDPASGDERPALEVEEDEQAVCFPFASGCGDITYEVQVSSDLGGWQEAEGPLAWNEQVVWGLGGHRFARLRVGRRAGFRLDSDCDGMDDFFEEGLVGVDPWDGFTHIGEVEPEDDFDGDGIANLDEEANAPERSGEPFASPRLIAAGGLNVMLEGSADAGECGELEVHTPLRGAVAP